MAWVFGTLSSLLFAMTSTFVVLYEPAAGGSGMPEVISYLNGVKLRKYFTVRVLVRAKNFKRSVFMHSVIENFCRRGNGGLRTGWVSPILLKLLLKYLNFMPHVLINSVCMQIISFS
jgi:hypothetical protein